MLLFFLASLALAAINLNSATQAELESLPGIGESKATAIIQYRTDHGPFKTVDELDNVSGIGPATLASLRDLVSVGAADPSKPAATTGSSVPSPTATSSCGMNINKADAGTLQDLPGIGESKAAAIVQYRTDNGLFTSCDQLDNVSGIGSATLAGLQECCTVK